MRKLIIANWKMHYGPVKAGGWVRAFRRERLPKDLDVSIAVPDVSRAAQFQRSRRRTRSGKPKAPTGETSPTMLNEFGVVMCLVGHSERRKYLGETDEMVAKKAVALQRAGVSPVICVGETDADKKRGATMKVIRVQVS